MEELLKHDLEEAYFYMKISDLYIKLPIVEVIQGEETNPDGMTLMLGNDDASHLIIWRDGTEVKKVRRPSNIIGNFEYCYLIKNSDKELVGYIGR